jgi:hypothetical protein
VTLRYVPRMPAISRSGECCRCSVRAMRIRLRRTRKESADESRRLFPERLSQYIDLKARRDIHDPAWRDEWNVFASGVSFNEMERLALDAKLGPGISDAKEAEGWPEPRV